MEAFLPPELRILKGRRDDRPYALLEDSECSETQARSQNMFSPPFHELNVVLGSHTKRTTIMELHMCVQIEAGHQFTGAYWPFPTNSMVESLPTEILEKTIQYLLNSYDIELLPTLASCALVNKVFNTLACRHLYASVHFNADYYPALKSISSNPQLGRYVKSFRTARVHDFDDTLWDHKEFPEAERDALLAFSYMDRLRFLSLSPALPSETFFLGSHEHDRWSSLQELCIWGLHPFQFMWNPRQVAASRSLAGLTKLRWSFFNSESKLPFSWDHGNIRLVQNVSFLVAVLELSCPSLTHLDIEALNPRYDTEAWERREGDWRWEDYQSTLERAAGACHSPSEFPCQFDHISSLSLRFFDDKWEEEPGETLQSIEWATAFFRPQLHSISDLCIHLPRFATSIYEHLLDPFGISSSPSIVHLTLEAPCLDPTLLWDPDSTYWSFSIPRSIAPHHSFQVPLQTLALKFPIAFNAELVASLQQFSCLRSLFLALDTTDWVDLDIADGYWLQWENLQIFLLDKIQYLPLTLQELVFHANEEVELDPSDWLGDRLSFEPAFSQHLLNLISLDITLATTDSRGDAWRLPRFEVYTRRLASVEDSQRILATTWLINNECGDCRTHRNIAFREVKTIEPKSGKFGGTDHLVAWTYSADEIEIIMDCCKSLNGCLDYWDPFKWEWWEEDDSEEGSTTATDDSSLL